MIWQVKGQPDRVSGSLEGKIRIEHRLGRTLPKGRKGQSAVGHSRRSALSRCGPRALGKACSGWHT